MWKRIIFVLLLDPFLGDRECAATDSKCRRTTTESVLLQTKQAVTKTDPTILNNVSDGTSLEELQEFKEVDTVYDKEGTDDDVIVNVSFTEPDLFNAMDTNKDGKLTRAEYNAAMQKLSGGSSPSPNPPPSRGSSPTPSSAPAPPPSGGGGGGGGSPGKTPTTIPDRWVNAHNYWRCIHGSPPIAWDVDIARGAQKWADRGQMSHAKSYKIPPPEGPCGENLAGGSHVTIEKAVDMWHDENPEKGPRCGGHCTAMLWKAGVKLGCGTGKSSMGHLYVCRYGGGNPLPNFGGRGNYDANVGFPDNSKKDACKKKWPLGAGATPGGSPSGGSGRGRSPSGSGRRPGSGRSRRSRRSRRGWR